jgi:hypothetical protein
MESVFHQLSTAHLDNSDTTEFATKLAQLEAALKETSVKEFAQLVHGHTTMDAIELAQLNTLPMMPALILALLEPIFRMEFAKLFHKAAHREDSLMLLVHHAKTVNSPAVSAL